MKKIYIALLAALVLLMSACSKIEDSASDESDLETSQSSLTASGAETETSPDLPSETAAPALSGAASSSSAESSSPAGTAPPASAAPAVTTTTAPVTVRVTITEGMSLAQIGKTLEQSGVCTRQALLDTVNSYDFSYYPLVGALGSDPNRCYKLEGYLYPDTYEFYLNQKPQDVVGKFLRNLESKITDAYRSRAAELGYSVDQILTLASIIEKESAAHDQMKTVSSVFHNRLNAGQKLQSDATIHYIEWYVKPLISGDQNRYNSYYNTYKCAALPSGPISSPGADAIEAALYPDSTGYYYFVNDTAGNYYFAATYEEHVANCAKAGVTPISQGTS